MEQILAITATIPVTIPEDKILIDKVEYQELKEKDFDGWVGMKVFTQKAHKSAPTVSNLLKRPELIKRLSVENGGWIYYPDEGQQWAFHYREMMKFIDEELYHKYDGGQ